MRKLVCLFSVVITLTACGKKGPLIYPDMLVPAAPSDVSAQQSGNSIKLSFVLPSKDLAGRKYAGLTGVTILRRDEPAGQIPGCSACMTDFTLFRKLNLDLLPPETQRYGSRVVLLDGDVQSGRTYTYRVSAVTRENQEGALSSPAATVVVSPPLPPVVQVISQPTEIQLEIKGMSLRGGGIAGYNINRSLKGEAVPLQPLNRELLTGNQFVDTGLDRRTTYVYHVRTVVRLQTGGSVESSLSNEVEGRLKDDE
jgi:predicted small lipoprotein YifL